MPPTGDLACNPGTCPDWELNRGPFGSQVSAQSMSPTSQGSSLVSPNHAHRLFLTHATFMWVYARFSKWSMNTFPHVSLNDTHDYSTHPVCVRLYGCTFRYTHPVPPRLPYWRSLTFPFCTVCWVNLRYDPNTSEPQGLACWSPALAAPSGSPRGPQPSCMSATSKTSLGGTHPMGR